MNRYALFTCDTEFMPPWNSGTWQNQDRSFLTEAIEIMENILSRYGIRGTFYCQGILVRDYPELVRDLAKRHCIGSHGYNHENYGGLPVRVYTKEEPVFIGDKEKKYELLSECVRIHRDVLGYNPEVFVSPFDSIDYDLLEILETLQFKVDSSFNNYWLGLPSKPFKPLYFNIYELPSSIIRFENIGFKNVLQGLTYEYSKISDIIGNEIIYITSHPWEFVNVKIPHPDHVLIVGDRKIKTMERLIPDLLGAGYEFVDPLGLLEKQEKGLS